MSVWYIYIYICIYIYMSLYIYTCSSVSLLQLNDEKKTFTLCNRYLFFNIISSLVNVFTSAMTVNHTN